MTLEFDLNVLKDGTLNKYINAERRNRFIASKIKKRLTHYCFAQTQRAVDNGLSVEWPVTLKICYHVPNRRTDTDNWAFTKKFMLDGMQKAKLPDGSLFLPDDGMKYIVGYEEKFFVDRERPKAHIQFKKVKKGDDCIGG